ncbi:MAG: ribosome recycling factor [Candidatus Vogelbacteria bacterium]|nr:ribosome recycling factor [Candidatus Vogelbacteria bacterium]
MNYNFFQFKKDLKVSEDWLASEFSVLRTGRVSPSILDSITVESYGSWMPIAHVAAISIEDAKTLRVAPWDNTLVKGIEKAIMAANLGVSVAPDSSGIRVSFPDLTEDRRKSLLKVVSGKLEEARVKIRHDRDKEMANIMAKEKAKEITEDERFKLKEDVQGMVVEANQKLEDLAKKKENEIMS